MKTPFFPPFLRTAYRFCLPEFPLRASGGASRICIIYIWYARENKHDTACGGRRNRRGGQARRLPPAAPCAQRAAPGHAESVGVLCGEYSSTCRRVRFRMPHGAAGRRARPPSSRPAPSGRRHPGFPGCSGKHRCPGRCTRKCDRLICALLPRRLPPAFAPLPVRLAVAPHGRHGEHRHEGQQLA